MSKSPHHLWLGPCVTTRDGELTTRGPWRPADQDDGRMTSWVELDGDLGVHCIPADLSPPGGDYYCLTGSDLRDARISRNMRQLISDALGLGAVPDGETIGQVFLDAMTRLVPPERSLMPTTRNTLEFACGFRLAQRKFRWGNDPHADVVIARDAATVRKIAETDSVLAQKVVDARIKKYRQRPDVWRERLPKRERVEMALLARRDADLRKHATSYSDDFTASDQTNLPGWEANGYYSISSNRAVRTSGQARNSVQYGSALSSDDQLAECTVIGINTTNAVVGAGVRVIAGTVNCQGHGTMWRQWNSDRNEWQQVSWTDRFTANTHASSTDISFPASAIVRCQMEGTTLTSWLKRAGEGSFTQVAQTTVASPGLSGELHGGIGSNGSSTGGTVDDWSVQDLVSFVDNTTPILRAVLC